MGNKVSYEFICRNDPEKSFKLDIKKSKINLNNLEWLMKLA